MLVGERLRAVREAKKLSQGHIEKATGLLRCYVSRCENGHTVPSIETLEKWCKALDINLSQLFADDGKAPKPRRKPATSYDNTLRDLGTRYVKGYTAPSVADLLENAPFTE